MVGQTPLPPKVVARKMPKDELLLSRQRFLVVVEIVLGFSLLFVFGGALAFGISDLGGATASGGLPSNRTPHRSLGRRWCDFVFARIETVVACFAVRLLCGLQTTG